MVEYNVTLEGKTVLVTGAAGFIGSNLVKRLFHDVKNIKVIGIDSITDYYDVNIKYERLKEIEALNRDWTFVHASIADKEAVDKIFTENKISVVVNLAAQAGVRYSITNPDAYIQSNLIGFYNILETYQMAKKRKDTKTMEKAATSYAKFNRIDIEDEQSVPYHMIVVQPFFPTTDPRVVGINPVPNIDERIRKLTRELSDTHPDTENVEYEEADLPLDEIFKEEDDGQGEE